MNVEELLIAGRKQVERAWHGGLDGAGNFTDFKDLNKPRCAVGCLNFVHGEDNWQWSPVRLAAVRALNSANDGLSTHAWNDQPGRTKAEVLALFDKAIAAVSEKTS